MDPSDMASCFATNGFTIEGSKAGAFDFFARGVNDYGKNDNLPKRTFIFKTGDCVTGVSAVRLFLISSLNNGQGIFVDVNSGIPEGFVPEPNG